MARAFLGLQKRLWDKSGNAEKKPRQQRRDSFFCPGAGRVQGMAKWLGLAWLDTGLRKN